MATANESNSPILNVECLHLSSIDSHLRGVIRTRWALKNLDVALSLSEQMCALLDDIPPDGPRNPWLLSLSVLSLVFGVSKMTIKRMVKRKKKSGQGIPPSPHHRPPKNTPKMTKNKEKFEKI